MSEPSLRRSIPGGLLDTAAASLGTFLVQIAAVRWLAEDQLGLYALFFSAFVLVKTIPSLVAFEPLEIEATRRDAAAAIALVRRTRGWWRFAPIAGLVTVVVATPFTGGSSPETLVPLAVTAWVATAVAGFEEHVRRALHIGGRSSLAARLSGAQLAAVVVALPLGRALDVPAPWIPFSALAIGQAVSLGLAWRACGADDGSWGAIDLRSTFGVGKWLLAGGLAAPAAAFASNAIIKLLAGVAALGHVEAARVLARPVTVAGVGLMSVVGPRTMRHAAAGAWRMVSRYTSAYALSVTVAGVVMAWVVWGPLGPMVADALPNAFAVDNLALAAVGAAVLAATSSPLRSSLIGAGGVRAVSGLEAMAGLARVVASFLAAVIGAMAGPVGFAASGVAQWVGYGLAHRGVGRETARR